MAANARTILRVLVPAALLACSDPSVPAGPSTLDPASDADLLRVDAQAGVPSGIPGFQFLAPVGSDPMPAGELDASLLELLVVEVCEWTGAACASTPIRRFTPQGRPPEGLRVTEEGTYRAVWNTRNDALDPARTYRIRVLASGGELGHADVDVVDAGEPPAPETAGQVRLVRGSTLPIEFLVEKGAGARMGEAGGTIVLADGAVTLQLPEGALDEDVFLTAVPATLPPGGPAVVPGTVWDFGPDGLTFAQPVVMTIRYDPAAVPAGVPESELRIHEFVNGAFEQQDAGLVDLENHTVSAEVDGFSVYVVMQRDRQNPEDVEAPLVRSIRFRDAGSGTFGGTATLDVSGGDAVLTTRIHITDNVTGVQLVDIRYVSPTGRQLRFPCYTNAPPTSGSDTNGQWECQAVFPRHAEGGTWKAQYVIISDNINNRAFYVTRPGGFCDQQGNCIASLGEVVVTSGTPDVTPPVLHSLGVSLGIVPQSFGPSVSVDASAGARVVYFGFQATDDLSGVGDHLPFDGFTLHFRGPSNQTQVWGGCSLTQGTRLNGFWTCQVHVPAQAEPGTWRLSFLRVPDRAGNGGFSGYSDFTLGGTGQLCNRSANCLPSPTVEVTGAGDGQPPALQTLGIVADEGNVTTTLGITDDVSGTSWVLVTYTSVLTNQYQQCWAGRTAGTATDGTWSCTIAFSQFAARGQWILSLTVWDVAGNSRGYSRRATDGFLCHYDPATLTQVCQDFGDTDLVLQ